MLLLPVLAVSCNNTKSSDYSDPYATSYGADGGYNPYPDASGSSSSSPYEGASDPGYAASTPSYDAPPSYDSGYSYQAPTSTPKPTYTAPKPKPKPKPKATVSSSSRSHTVAKGDTLYSLSRRYGTSVSKIQSANGLSGNLIRIGQRLKIP